MSLELNSTVTPLIPVPFFVVIKIAPFKPLEPYKAPALGPFRIVYDSTSSALIFQVSELMGTPSTTYKISVFPLNTTCGVPMNSDDAPTAKPATLPASELIAFASRDLVKSSPVTSCVE